MSAAKNLVTYSDEEEDANYDDVGMDMSDDEGGDNDKEAAKDSAVAASSEYGPGPSKSEQASEYGSFEPPPKKKNQEPRPTSSVSERLMQMSSNPEVDDPRGGYQQREQHRRDGRDRVSASASQEREEGRGERDRDFRGEHEQHPRDRHHRRRRSRSRSRERRRRSRSRSRERRRRSRSREREWNRRRGSPPQFQRGGRTGDRGHRDDQRSRDELRTRKMQAMGIVTEGEGDPAAMVKEMTGVEMPSYYAPNAINPLKYAEGVKKRQMLWGAKPPKPTDPMLAGASSSSSTGPLNFTAATSTTEKEVAKVSGSANLPAGVIMPKQKVPSNSPFKQSFNKWENTNFGDNKANEKFRRLMGIKSSAGPPPPKATEAAAASAAVTEESHSAAGNTEKTAAMFREQEEQYERARAITHTAKGLGLGFSSLGPP